MSIEQTNLQQLAVAANLSATEGLNQVLRSELEREVDTENSSKVEESPLKKALEGKTQKLGVEIIASLVSKLAQSMPTVRLLGDLQKEYGFLLDQEESPREDLVEINNPISQVSKPQKQKQNLNSNSNFSEENGSALRNASADIKEYIGIYSQMLVSGSSELKKKLNQIEQHLVKEEGISLKELLGVKIKVANQVRAGIMQQMKQTYLKQVMADEKTIEWAISKKEAQNVLDFAFHNTELGGYDFGGYENHLQGAADRVKEETHQELRDFVNDELMDKVMKKAMGKESKKIEKDIEDLLKLGSKIGFDLQEFLEKIPKMKDHLGLDPLIEYEYAAANANMGDSSQGRHCYKYTPEEEKEILSDKLRALYLRRAVGDISLLESQFKMIKLKNGLIRLGVKNFDEIESQGKALAKVKLFEMLREGFEERAAYAKLSGEAWKMTERKIKTVVRNLEKLGVNLSQAELDLIRDKANERMISEAEHELALIKVAIEARGEIAYLTSKKKMVLGILDRVARESGFKAAGEELKLSIQDAC